MGHSLKFLLPKCSQTGIRWCERSLNYPLVKWNWGHCKAVRPLGTRPLIRVCERVRVTLFICVVNQRTQIQSPRSQSPHDSWSESRGKRRHDRRPGEYVIYRLRGSKDRGTWGAEMDAGTSSSELELGLWRPPLSDFFTRTPILIQRYLLTGTETEHERKPVFDQSYWVPSRGRRFRYGRCGWMDVYRPRGSRSNIARCVYYYILLELLRRKNYALSL